MILFKIWNVIYVLDEITFNVLHLEQPLHCTTLQLTISSAFSLFSKLWWVFHSPPSNAQKPLRYEAHVQNVHQLNRKKLAIHIYTSAVVSVQIILNTNRFHVCKCNRKAILNLQTGKAVPQLQPAFQNTGRTFRRQMQQRLWPLFLSAGKKGCNS